MQSTSALWNSLWASGNACLQAVAVINNNEYTAISNPVINRALMQDELSIGNVVSATCQFSIRTNDTIPRSAEVRVKMRLTDGTQTSEWLPAGTFYIAHRQKDPVTGLLSLECYDALLKANAEMPALFPITDENGEPITDENGNWVCSQAVYPCSMSHAAEMIALILGVEIDARTDLATGSAYVIQQPETGTSIHDVLAQIAAANGGNWIITPANRLRLVPVVPPLNGSTVSVAGVIGEIVKGDTVTITGIRYTDDDVTHIVGTDAGVVVDAEVSAAIAQTLSAWIVGRTYQAYEMRGAVYNPAAELGDTVTRLQDISAVVEREVVTLGPAFRGELSAPEPGELADEFPYIGQTERTFMALRSVVATKASVTYVDQAEARANAVTAALNAALDQQGVFNRLTNNGQTQGIYLHDGKLYINSSYIDTGTLNANLIRAGVIADASGQNYWVLDGNNSEFVTRKGIIGNFTIDNGDLQWGSQEVGGTGAYIGKNGISYNETSNEFQSAWPDNLIKTEIFPQGLKFYWDNTIRTLLYIYDGGVHVRCYDPDGVATYPFQIWDSASSQNIYFRYPTTYRDSLRVEGATTITNRLTVSGNLTVSGTKNRRVATGDYGDRLLYCYETPAPMFGDVGEGVIGEDGRCYVWLDPVFAQTVATGQYQVFLQKYGAGDCWVEERRAGCFVVAGTPNLAFGWELKARQRDFDQRRLDAPIEPPERSRADFAAMAQAHLDRLHEGRMDT